MANLNVSSEPTQNSDGLAVVAAHNPIQFKVTTDTIGTDNYAYAWIQVTGPTITSGTVIEVNGTAYTASDDPGFGQYLTTTSSTLLEIAQSIAAMLSNDPGNYEYGFEVLPSGPYPMVFMVAIKPGSEYNISLTVGTGIAVFGNLAGSDKNRGQSLQDYKVWVELYSNELVGFAQYLNSSPAFSPANRLVAAYDLNWHPTNEMTFDVSGSCSSYTASPRPSTATGIFRQSEPVRAFFIRYGESYVPAGKQNPRRVQIGQSDVFYTVNSALGTLAPNSMLTYASRQPSQKLLTEEPTSRSVRTTDTTWMTFLHYSPGAVQRWVGAYIQATFYDDTTAVVGTFFKTAVQNGYHTMRIDPASWAMTSFEQSQGKLVKLYDVYLVESLNANFTGAYKFSEIRRFEIDRTCPSGGMVQFAWVDSLGGWSGFTFFGELTTDIEREIATYSRGRSDNYTSTDIVEAVSSVGFAYSNTAYSGLMDGVTFRWLRDSMLKSHSVNIIAGTALIPVVIVGHSAKSSTEDFTYSLSVTFQLSAPVNVVTG